DVRAPVEGTVSSLLVSKGDHTSGFSPLLSILPAGTELQATLMVPDRAIAHVRTGQPVSLALDALPQQHYGKISGSVSHVSSHTLLPGDTRIPINLSGPSYSVLVNIHDTESPNQLKPDMALSAEIMLQQRTLAQWLANALNGKG
ncbi:MAG: HlyD family efflux transporter periplasmic adaptor subunit, partial [Gammaproteobacteria bacterium]|nr:HlyD family efflux transporter periplasmic adaptor subunit [Gammaproteobacteria bacterium]